MNLTLFKTIYHKIEASLPKENYKRIPLAIASSITLIAIARMLFHSEKVLNPGKKRVIKVIDRHLHSKIGTETTLYKKLRSFKKGQLLSDNSVKLSYRHLFYTNENRKDLYKKIWTPYLQYNEALVHIFETAKVTDKKGMCEALEQAMTELVTNEPSFNKTGLLLCKEPNKPDQDDIKRLCNIIVDECYCKAISHETIRDQFHIPFAGKFNFVKNGIQPLPDATNPQWGSMRQDLIRDSHNHSFIIPLLHLNNRQKRGSKTQISAQSLTKILWFLRHYYRLKVYPSATSEKSKPDDAYIKGKGEIKWIASHISPKKKHSREHKKQLQAITELDQKKTDLEKKIKQTRAELVKISKRALKETLSLLEMAKAESLKKSFKEKNEELKNIEENIQLEIEKIVPKPRLTHAKKKLKENFF